MSKLRADLVHTFAVFQEFLPEFFLIPQIIGLQKINNQQSCNIFIF